MYLSHLYNITNLPLIMSRGVQRGGSTQQVKGGSHFNGLLAGRVNNGAGH